VKRNYVATIALSITADSHAAATTVIEEAVRLYNAEQSKVGVNGRNYVKVEEVAKLKEDK
jgi:hypothetical protein